MIDHIISSDGTVYAVIEYNKSDKFDYHYEGIFLEFKFPERLVWLIKEYNEIISCVAISLLEEVEDEIYSYGLSLKDAGACIFDISVTDEKISFFTKYPSSSGFLESYPGNII